MPSDPHLEGQTGILANQPTFSCSFQNFLLEGGAKSKMTLISVCQPWHPWDHGMAADCNYTTIDPPDCWYCAHLILTIITYQSCQQCAEGIVWPLIFRIADCAHLILTIITYQSYLHEIVWSLTLRIVDCAHLIFTIITYQSYQQLKRDRSWQGHMHALLILMDYDQSHINHTLMASDFTVLLWNY